MIRLSDFVQVGNLEEKKLYDIDQNRTAGERLIDAMFDINYSYVNSGIALVMSPIPVSGDSIPKVLYLKNRTITLEELYKLSKHARNQLMQLYSTRQYETRFGMIVDADNKAPLFGAGMKMSESSIFSFDSIVNEFKHADIWKQITFDKSGWYFFLYQIWTRKDIYDVQKQVEKDLLLELIRNMVSALRSKKYPQESFYEKDIQTELRYIIENGLETREMLIKEFGEIASEQAMAWMDNETDAYWEEKFIASAAPNPNTMSEKWCDEFENDVRMPYPTREIVARFKKYYEHYKRNQ